MDVGLIKGEEARPLWKYLYKATKTSSPTWNFKGKYLIDRAGKVHTVTNLEAQIAEFVAQPAPKSAL